MAAKKDNILEVRNLRVSYHTYAGEVQSVRGVDFDVERGETLAIVGESGCGKSVTMRAIMGLIKGPTGEVKPESFIYYNGENVLAYDKKQWAHYRGAEASIIFQDALTALNPTMTAGKQIAENLRLHKNISKKDAFNEAVEMLRSVGIPQPERRAKQYPHEFSGGMRQRVMIAMAFACNPHLLIADEPTTALDVTIQAQILDVITDLQKQHGTSVILITHDLGVVADIAKHIVVMYSGKIVERGLCDEIFYKPRHPYTWSILGAVPRLDLENKQELVAIEGTPPDLIAPPKGCPFASRCKFCMNICKREAPPPVAVFSESHEASCWLHHPLAKDAFDATGIEKPFTIGDAIEIRSTVEEIVTEGVDA